MDPQKPGNVNVLDLEHRRNGKGQESKSDTRIHQVYPKDDYSVTSLSSSESEDDDDDDEKEGLRLAEGQAQGHGHGHVGRIKRYAESYSSLKEPWVPAPGRSTRPRSSTSALNLDTVHQDLPKIVPTGTTMTDQSSGDGILKRPSTSTRNARRRSSTVHPNDDLDLEKIPSSNAADNWLESLTGFKLESKDSLVDVAACLNARREGVLKIWQDNLSNVSLVGDVEKANQLAIEAAADVSELRKSIHELHNKSTVTRKDSEALNQLRHRILSKLELFEKTHSEIMQNLTTISSASVAPAVVSRSNSSTTNLATADQGCQTKPTTTMMTFDPNVDDTAKSNPKSKSRSNSNSSLVYIKTKNPTFSDDDDDDLGTSELEAEVEMMSSRSAKKPDYTNLIRFVEKKKVSLERISEERREFQDKNGSRGQEIRLLTNTETDGVLRKPRISKSNIRYQQAQAQAPTIKNNAVTPSPTPSRAASTERSERYRVANVTASTDKPKPQPHKKYTAYPVFTTATTTTTTTTASEDEDDDVHKYRTSKVEVSSESDNNGDETGSSGLEPEPNFGQGARVEHEDLAYYRHKLQQLHRKLLNQDTKYEALTRHVQKYESQSNFDAKLFQASMTNRLQELEPYPELLLLTETRLADVLRSKFVLEADYQVKVQELSGAKVEIEKLTREASESKLQLGNSQNKCRHLEKKMEKYQRVAEAYSKMGKVKQELPMAQELTRTSRRSTVKRSDMESKDDRIPNLYFNNKTRTTKSVIFEDRIAELKRELKNEKANVCLLKDSKNSQSHRMKQRLEQVMEALDGSRRRNRKLLKQLHFIQASYSHHNIFPPGLFPGIYAKLSKYKETRFNLEDDPKTPNTNPELGTKFSTG